MAHRSPATTDAVLLERARRDPSAFDAVYRRHAAAIHRWFTGRIVPGSVALELTAETFAQAWSSLGRFRAPDDGNAGPWLQGIATNLYRSWSREQRVERGAQDRLGMQLIWQGEPEDDAVLEQLLVDQLKPALHSALAALPAEQRSAVELRVLGELPYDQVADRLGCTAGAARVRVLRGLRTMHDELRGEYA